ncbi:MAG: aromatic ring-hydroxylating dioxygenase subunit alpha [Cocleimonas sp.]
MTVAKTPDKNNFSAYCGYDQTWDGEPLSELTQTAPKTPCGEYLRRYWHPVHITSELSDKPKLIKIMGEELVLFQDKSGQYGLVHKKCPHRRASLEYGRCDDRGIRCCYHGWQFDIDGTILEIPGEEDTEAGIRVKQNVKLGAYPVKEFKGLLFAYLGPADETPDFPFYDTFDIPDMTMTPYAAPFACNWIQVLDAIVDPVHTAFLHQSQFSDGFGKLGFIKFYHIDKQRILGTASRRVGDNIWVRVNELILPNFTQAGAAFAADGTEERYFGRSAFTRWVVPVDDENCIAFAWGNFGERADPHEYNTPEGMQMIEQGEVVDRSYDEKQNSPGDVEAVEGMGKISDHTKENLVQGDKGVALYRHQIRRFIRGLQKGVKPPQPRELSTHNIPTYGSDTIIKRPQHSADEAEDFQTLEQINDAVMDILFAGDALNEDERDQQIIDQLKKL